MVAAASGNRRLLTHQSALITALPDGSTLAIADGSGNVLERYVHDGLSNAQALSATGIAYSADSDPGSTSAPPGQQINEYFSGSTFNSSGSQTADGTHYNWTILHQGENYDALPGLYETANGVFNPRQQDLLAPDLSVIQGGLGASAYDLGSGTVPGTGGWQSYIPVWGFIHNGIGYWQQRDYGLAISQFVGAAADAFLTGATLGASAVVEAGLRAGMGTAGKAIAENLATAATRQGLQRAATYIGAGAAIGGAVGTVQGGAVGYELNGWNGAWNGALPAHSRWGLVRRRSNSNGLAARMVIWMRKAAYMSGITCRQIR